MESNALDAVAKAPVSSSMWRIEQAEKKARAMKPEEKLALLYAIRDSGAGSEGKIPWVLIQRDDLHVHKQRMKLKICYRALKRMVPDYESLKLQEIVEYLIDAYETAAPAEPRGFKKAFYTIQLRAVSSTPSETPKGQKRIWPLDSDPEDNGEGPSTVNRSKPARKPRSRTSKAPAVEESEPEQMETPRPKRAKKGRTKSKDDKVAMTEEMENENVPSSAPKPKKKKLRERMKSLTDQISQETNGELGSTPVAEDFTSSFNAIKTGRVRTSLRGNNSASRSKSKSIFLSKEYVSESEDEIENAQDEAQESAAIEDSQPEKEKECESDDQQSVANVDKGFTARGGLAEDKVSVDEDEDEEDTSHEHPGQESAASAEGEFTARGRLIEDDVSVDEEEDEIRSHEDDLESAGSVGEEFTAPGGTILDEPSANEEDDESAPTHTRASLDSDIEDDADEHNITLNGFNTVNEHDSEFEEEEDESEEEEFRGRSPSKRAATPFTREHDKTPKINGYTKVVSNSRESSQVSKSSMGSMGDIPAIPRRSQLQRQREVSAEL